MALLDYNNRQPTKRQTNNVRVVRLPHNLGLEDFEIFVMFTF